jgi:hypothetical protein
MERGSIAELLASPSPLIAASRIRAAWVSAAATQGTGRASALQFK